jgi:hypothetical protein
MLKKRKKMKTAEADKMERVLAILMQASGVGVLSFLFNDNPRGTQTFRLVNKAFCRTVQGSSWNLKDVYIISLRRAFNCFPHALTNLASAKIVAVSNANVQQLGLMPRLTELNVHNFNLRTGVFFQWTPYLRRLTVQSLSPVGCANLSLFCGKLEALTMDHAELDGVETLGLNCGDYITELNLNFIASSEMVLLVSRHFPNLKRFSIRNETDRHNPHLADALISLVKACRKIVSLEVPLLRADLVEDMVRCLPDLQHLETKSHFLTDVNVTAILAGCKQLTKFVMWNSTRNLSEAVVLELLARFPVDDVLNCESLRGGVSRKVFTNYPFVTDEVLRAMVRYRPSAFQDFIYLETFPSANVEGWLYFFDHFTDVTEIHLHRLRVNDALLQRIAERNPRLRKITLSRLPMVTLVGVMRVVRSCPALQEVNISETNDDEIVFAFLTEFHPTLCCTRFVW